MFSFAIKELACPQCQPKENTEKDNVAQWIILYEVVEL